MAENGKYIRNFKATEVRVKCPRGQLYRAYLTEGETIRFNRCRNCPKRRGPATITKHPNGSVELTC